MNILLDTNIIIPLEDTGRELLSAYASLKRLGTEQKHCFFVHPSQIHDIKRDADVHRRTIMLSRLEQYSKIDSPPILSKSECAEIGWQSKNVNDEIDNAILFALYRGAVHLLVTNDEGIHKKAKQADLQEKVYRLNQFISFLSAYQQPSTSNFTGVKDGFLYQIDKRQDFFDSLRVAYNGFDSWYQKSAENQRKCWYIEDDKGLISAMCIYKLEHDEKLTDTSEITKGSILKLCTFKVDTKLRGKKLGERLLYIAFDYCIQNNIDWIYLHTYGQEQQSLIGLCMEYGFSNLGKYGDDDVYIKSMNIERETAIDPFHFMVKHYPYFLFDGSIRKFIIPIQPRYHEDLFPDHSNLKGSLFEKEQGLYSCQGNTIKKAYLCHSQTQHIRKGDIVLFYRSKDRCSIQCMGVVENVVFTDDINTVLPLIAKRTVFNLVEIEQILSKRTLIILFRYISLSKEITKQEITKADIKGNIQSIRQITHEQYLKLTK